IVSGRRARRGRDEAARQNAPGLAWGGAKAAAQAASVAKRRNPAGAAKWVSPPWRTDGPSRGAVESPDRATARHPLFGARGARSRGPETTARWRSRARGPPAERRARA